MRIVSVILLFIIALNAMAAGFSFMIDPTGSGVGISTNYLKTSAPFKDFFIPGVVLFCVIGVTCFASATFGCTKKPGYAETFIIEGALLICWIGIQLTMVNYIHLLHFIVAFAGVALIAMGALMRQPAKKQVIRHPDKN